MENEIVVPTAEAPAPEVVVTPAPEQKRYRYQPTDEFNRPIGGEQVILYTTEQELADKLRDQNVSILRKLREVTRKQRLGITDADDEVPAELPRYEGPAPLAAKELGADERFQIAQDISDPENFNRGRDRLLESAFGVSPEALRNRINSLEQTQVQQKALQDFQVFASQTEDFYPSAENNQTLTAYMVKNGIAPTVDNFKYAHSKLKAAGLLLDAPPVHEENTVLSAPAPTITEEANSQPPVAAESRITPEVQPQTKRQVAVPSGLNDRVSSATAPRSEGISITLKDINKMPTEEYKKKLSDPSFRALVDKLEKEAENRRKGVSQVSQ